jgi:S1-C subfamily serine protease
MQLIGQAGQDKPRLGASIADAASQAKKHPGIPASGAYVGKVKPGSAAEKAGLRPGDVITALGGQPIQRAGDLQHLLSGMPHSQELSLTYIRDGEAHYTSIRL